VVAVTLERPIARLTQRLDRNGDAPVVAKNLPLLVRSFDVGGPAPAAWREHVFTREAELRTLASVLAGPRSPESQLLLAAIDAHLDSARAAAERRGGRGLWKRFVAGVTGSDVERAMSNLDAAEATLLRLAPTPYLRGQMPSLLNSVRQHLPAHDPRRVRRRISPGVRRTVGSRTSNAT
jgi:hypothetical protein